MAAAKNKQKAAAAPPRRATAGSMAAKADVPLTVAQVHAALALMEIGNFVEPARRARWDLLVRLLPWYAQRFGEDPWVLPAREVMPRLLRAAHAELCQPEVFGSGIAELMQALGAAGS